MCLNDGDLLGRAEGDSYLSPWPHYCHFLVEAPPVNSRCANFYDATYSC